MRERLRRRTLRAAEYVIATGATVRACARILGVSKTTVHKDLRLRLPELDGELARQVDAVLQINLKERHARGGAATRQKNLSLHKDSEPGAQ